MQIQRGCGGGGPAPQTFGICLLGARKPFERAPFECQRGCNSRLFVSFKIAEHRRKNTNIPYPATSRQCCCCVMFRGHSTLLASLGAQLEVLYPLKVPSLELLAIWFLDKQSSINREKTPDVHFVSLTIRT